MSSSLQSAGAPGVPRCSEATTGAADPQAALARALAALEALDESLPHVHVLAALAMRMLEDSASAQSEVSEEVADECLAVLKGQASLALNACNVVFEALQALGKREAA